jgi:regulator of sigma E protease
MELLTGFGAWGGWILSYALPTLFVLTIVVFFHELGHFWVARRCGVKVDAFSVGFGPELIGFTDRHGTRWKFSVVPLGGYVRFHGDDSAASTPDQQSLGKMPAKERKVSFHHQTVGKRSAIVAAGPIANFILAILIFAAIVFVQGRQVTTPRIDHVQPGTSAAVAGFQKGDLVLAVGGKSVDSFTDVDRTIATNAGRPLEFVLDRSGRQVMVTATPEQREERDRFGNQLRIGRIDIGGPVMRPLAGAVMPGSAAETAGLVAGDFIVAIDGKEIETFDELRNIVIENPLERLTLQVLRDGRTMTLVAIPSSQMERTADGTVRRVGVLGISGGFHPDDVKHVRYGPFAALGAGVEQTRFVLEQTLSYVGQILTGRESADQLGGPIRIAQISGQVASVGFVALLHLTAVLSISIGLLNLFPVPLLDGGHLVYYAIEALRGKPLSERAQEYGFRIGLALVVMLMLFVTWNDILQLARL